MVLPHVGTTFSRVTVVVLTDHCISKTPSALLVGEDLIQFFYLQKVIFGRVMFVPNRGAELVTNEPDRAGGRILYAALEQ